MSDFKILWDNDALTQLDARDRYTRSVIRDLFSHDPGKEAREIDPEEKRFVTPVSNARYSVVWKRPEANLAIVEAILPVANVASMSLGDLKKSIEKAMAADLKVER